MQSFEKPKGVIEVSIDRHSYYDTHTILLADDIAPVEYRLTELFKKGAIPTKKSDFLSNPSIPTPTISLSKNGVKITFHKDTPTLYNCRIERYDYITYTTVYEGEFLPVFTDTTIEENHRYLYKVTPIYAGKAGKTIALPEIIVTLPKDKIAEKEWWEY